MRIALAVGATTLIIVTGEAQVSLDYGTPRQRGLDRLTLAEARHYHQQGQFPPGSMGPKIQAAIEYVQADPRNRTIITDVENLAAGLAGERGTLIAAY